MPLQEMKMNLLLILADQLSYNVLSGRAQRYVLTPRLNRLAREGTSFSSACCAFPKCVPSRTALLYGRMPHTLHLPGTELDYDAREGDPKRGIRPEFLREEMGRWFSKAGYDCVYAGKWHVGQWGPTESLKPEYGSGFRPLCPISDPSVPQVCTDYFRTLDKGKKFLMTASFDNPHNICEVATGQPLPWGALPAAPPLRDLPPLPANFHETPDEPLAIRQLRKRIREHLQFSPEEWRRYRWAYYRLVEKVDAGLGQLLDGLEASGLLGSTAIVFTTDHGDMQAAHGLREKDTFYEESVQIPFIVRLPETRFPDVPRGDVRTEPVSNALDLYPTLCELAGIDGPPGLPGTSLLSVLRGGPLRRPYVAAEQKFRFGGGEARMIRSARFKYSAYTLGPVREQLFDLENDPGEMENLAGCSAFDDVLRQHREFLREWLVHSADPYGETHYAHPGKKFSVPGDAWADL